MAIYGSPKQVSWASAIRSDRLKVWQATSPEKFAEIVTLLATMSDAGWWIAYRDKDIATVYHHLQEGIDLRKFQKDEWVGKQKRQEQKDRAEVRSFLKKELEKESREKKRGAGQDVAVTGALHGNHLVKYVGPAIDCITGKVNDDPDLPF